jgi:hypothetical protein
LPFLAAGVDALTSTFFDPGGPLDDEALFDVPELALEADRLLGGGPPALELLLEALDDLEFLLDVDRPRLAGARPCEPDRPLEDASLPLPLSLPKMCLRRCSMPLWSGTFSFSPALGT